MNELILGFVGGIVFTFWILERIDWYGIKLN